MKKIGYLFISIISFIGISSVKADTLNLSSFYNHFDESINYYNTYNDKIINLVSIWESKYKSSHPYYIIRIHYNSSQSIKPVELYASSSNKTKWSTWNLVSSYTTNNVLISYNPNTDEFTEETNDFVIPLYDRDFSSSILDLLNPGPGAYKDEDMVKDNGFIYNNVPSSYGYNGNDYTSDYDKIIFPSFSSSQYDFSISEFEITENDLLPSYLDLYNGNYEKNIFEHYTEINLNEYEYVALSLKDYSLRNDNVNQFSTNIYTKGQLCLTPVYDYGMKEKIDYYSDYQVDRCSVIYDDFTPVRTYILKQDLQNNAIYYLKAYDTTIENKVKVDSTIFNITYINTDSADNPSVNVNGKNYPTIAYNDLSSSSTKSEEEGYVSGQVVNAMDQLDENFINNFFSNPLKALKSVWGAIISILSLISMFIALLPPTMQGFLYIICFSNNIRNYKNFIIEGVFCMRLIVKRISHRSPKLWKGTRDISMTRSGHKVKFLHTRNNGATNPMHYKKG